MRTRFCLKALLLPALALALVLCLGGAAWADGPFPNAVPLTLGVEADASIQNGGDYAYFRFTPSVTREYVFTSNASSDTYGYLYDAEGNQITSDDDSGSSTNFSITWTLDAGTTYYFGARYYSSSNTGSFPVLLCAENGLRVSAIGDTWRTVSWGDSVTMAVDAACNEGGLSYQWFLRSSSWEGTDEPISGATASSYTLSPATNTGRYLCRVTDDFGSSRQVEFSVNIDNSLTAEAVSKTMVLAEPGERVSFQVEASCGHGTLHYRWVSEMNPELSGGDAPQFTMTAAERDWISCIVSDECGNEQWIDFTLVVKTGLWAVPVADTYYKIYGVVEVPKGQTAVLRVEAGSDAGQLSYSWRSEKLGELSGTGPQYTTGPINSYDTYYCTVSDAGGGSEEVRFEVSNRPVTLALNTDTPANITESNDVCEFLFTPAESGDYLFFSIGELDTSGMLYDDSGNIVQFDSDSGTGGNFMLNLNLTAGETYRLGAQLSDDSTGSFSVRMVPDTHLNAVADNAYPTVKPREELTMSVSVSGGTAPYSYRWYTQVYDYDQHDYVRTLISGATGSSYTWPALGSAPEFLCEVTDGSGVNDSVIFYPYVDNKLQISEADYYDRYVPLGETTELSVHATCSVGSISYRWFAEEDRETILSTTNVLTTAPITGHVTYICEVSDEYGSNLSWGIRVWVDNALTVTPEDTVRVTVALGASADLEVSASCLRGSVHYLWRDSQWNELQTDTGASSVLTVSDVRTAGNYQCTVTDDYGNEATVRFEVYVDNGFTAVAEGAADAEETKIVTVPYGGATQLKVLASCNTGSLHYRWSGPGVTDDGSDGSTLTVRNVTNHRNYYCAVSDDYGNMAFVDFEIRVDNAFSAEAAGKPVFCAEHGDTVTLSVNASCREGALTYNWFRISRIYGDTAYIPVEGADGPSISVKIDARVQYYFCEVTDQYNNYIEVEFAVLDPDIVLPEGLKRVESEAFAGMQELVVWAPPSVTEIASDAFDPSTLVLGEYGTYAFEYGMDRMRYRFYDFLEPDE